MADQVRDEQPLSMSMFVNPADYWQAMYQRRETEAYQLSAQVIRLRAALRDLLDDTQHSEHHCGDDLHCPVIRARAALKGDKP